MATEKTTDASFEADVLKSAKPVVVDFWAEWCGPCRMIAPFLEELSEEMGDQVSIVKVDVDSNPAIAGQFRIMSIPTMIAFKNGQPIAQKVGAGSKSDLKKWIESAIA